MNQDVTRLLVQWREGNRAALDALLPVVYEELRRLAESYISRERSGHTLQPTALVHEAYLRLVGGGEPHFETRGHFFTASAEAMRRILIDRARSKGRQKRGGGARQLELNQPMK